MPIIVGVLVLALLMVLILFFVYSRDRGDKLRRWDAEEASEVRPDQKLRLAEQSKLYDSFGLGRTLDPDKPLLPHIDQPDGRVFKLRGRALAAKGREEGIFTDESNHALAAYRVKNDSLRAQVAFESPVGTVIAVGEVRRAGQGNALSAGSARILRAPISRWRKSEQLIAVIDVTPHGSTLLVTHPVSKNVIMRLQSVVGADGLELTSASGQESWVAQYEPASDCTRIRVAPGVDPGLLLCASIVGRLLLAPSANPTRPVFDDERQ